jgi:purine-nucleoside phosphorylase
VTRDAVARAADRVRALAPGAAPRIAVILGSGWGDVTAHVQDARRIAYTDIDGFPAPAVQGHSGELWLGRIGSHEVAVLSGRKHVYEEGDVQAMKVPLLTLHALGCQVLVQTNAAGSLDPRMPPGSLMVLSDHINPSQRTPLHGEQGVGRFVDMVNAYDTTLRAGAKAVATRSGVTLHEGVYVWHLGPQFETPAEIRMFQVFGGSAVGMSTVPETILARRAGMRVLAMSLMTNMACGLSDEALSHANTLAQARAGSARAAAFLRDVITAIEP